MSSPILFLKALSDQTRLKILMLIALKGDLCVCELSAALEEVQPKISRHLARLRSDGLVFDERKGQWVFYQLAELPDWVEQTLTAVGIEHPDFIADCVQRLDSMGARPERLKRLCADG